MAFIARRIAFFFFVFSPGAGADAFFIPFAMIRMGAIERSAKKRVRFFMVMLKCRQNRSIEQISGCGASISG